MLPRKWKRVHVMLFNIPVMFGNHKEFTWKILRFSNSTTVLSNEEYRPQSSKRNMWKSNQYGTWTLRKHSNLVVSVAIWHKRGSLVYRSRSSAVHKRLICNQWVSPLDSQNLYMCVSKRQSNSLNKSITFWSLFFTIQVKMNTLT